ncbi:uncharacterized aarF domain-containing protein kinase 5-like isoform X1 [Ornithodoros turicata]|uniref:uncharacterized aarF domain-containing protein kinase 5-like isoform X1 n=1 Tax=Ornithodoros turicata TaxID=34597 RepID=UPI00313A0002
MCSVLNRSVQACRKASYSACFHTAAKQQKRNFKHRYFIAIGSAVVLPYGWYLTLNSSDRRYVRVTLGGFRRFTRTFLTGLTISCDYWYSLLGKMEGTKEYKEALHECHQRAADRILAGCLTNGGLYIKLGQSLVALNHLMPREYLETLEVLHDKALPRVKDELNELFREDFDSSPEEMFKEFNRNPIAAASLAQVFKARTQDGKDVAVKVQYIDLQQRFFGDLNSIGILMHFVTWMHPSFNFAWILDYLRSCLVKELDFVNEGHNMERCASDLKCLPFVYVPKVHWEKTSKRVLTMEYIDGVKISDVSGILKLGLTLSDVDTKMVAAFAEQVFHTGFVHADPHPGNVFVQKDARGKARIVLLDHGLYEFIPKANRISLSQLWRCIIMDNEEGMQKHSLELGVSNYKVFCEILMQRPLQRRTLRIRNRLSSEEIAYMSTMVRQHFDDVMECIRSLPRPMLLVFRNINTVRSITKNHGHPIDRFTLMARIATRQLTSHVEGINIPLRLQYWWRWCSFELRLRYEAWCLKLTLLYLRFCMLFKASSKDVQYLVELISGDVSPL